MPAQDPHAAADTIVVDVLCMRATKCTVLAGSLEEGFSDGLEGASTKFDSPQAICMPNANTLLICDRNNCRIRAFNLQTGELTTFAGNGDLDGVEFDDDEPVHRRYALIAEPGAMCLDPNDPTAVLVGCDGPQKVIRRISLADNMCTWTAGQLEPVFDDEFDQFSAAEVEKRYAAKHADATSAEFSDFSCLNVLKLNCDEYPKIYSTHMMTNSVRVLDPRTNKVDLVVGDGMPGAPEQMRLQDPMALSADSKGRLLISCYEGNTILRFDPSAPEDSKKRLEVIAGQFTLNAYRDGVGTDEAYLGEVAGLCVDPFDTVYFCDYSHGAIRAISPEGFVYTLVCADPEYASVGFALNAPFSIIFDQYAYEMGRPRLFVVDFHRLIQIDLDPDGFPQSTQPLTTGRRVAMEASVPNEFIEDLFAMSTARCGKTNFEPIVKEEPLPEEVHPWAHTQPEDWEKLLDPDTGDPYWENIKTLETTWENPFPGQKLRVGTSYSFIPLHQLQGVDVAPETQETQQSEEYEEAQMKAMPSFQERTAMHSVAPESQRSNVPGKQRKVVIKARYSYQPDAPRVIVNDKVEPQLPVAPTAPTGTIFQSKKNAASLFSKFAQK